MAWILTQAAIADFDRIAAAGAMQFGFVQSERYERELADALDALAAHPYSVRERRAVHRVVRIKPCGSHNIIFVVENEDVVVLRVLHGLQNWFDLL